jgi:hypothetical protein
VIDDQSWTWVGLFVVIAFVLFVTIVAGGT